jgi:hypothetical protein
VILLRDVITSLGVIFPTLLLEDNLRKLFFFFFQSSGFIVHQVLSEKARRAEHGQPRQISGQTLYRIAFSMHLVFGVLSPQPLFFTMSPLS